MNLFRMRITFRMPKKYDFYIHIAVIALIAFGSLMIISTSMGETFLQKTVVIKTLVKQTVFVVASYIGMLFFANNFTMSRAKWWCQPIGYLLVALLVICLLFEPVGGSRAWIRFPIPFIGEFTLQPSEFFKTFMIALMAITVEMTRRKNFTWWNIVKIPVLFFIVACGIILVQNDTGSVIVISLICCACFLIPSHPNLKKVQRIMMIAIAAGCVFSLFVLTPAGLKTLEKVPFLQEHQLSRFVIADNPFSDPYGEGYQLINSLYAFTTGKWTGLGLGQSIQKMAYLPAATTDYILAIVVEELGILGFVYILFFYGVIIYRLFYYAYKAKSEGYKIVFTGTAMYLFIHFVFNVGGVTGFLPLTGIPLLFISSGASSLLSICCALGICQAIIAKMNAVK